MVSHRELFLLMERYEQVFKGIETACQEAGLQGLARKLYETHQLLRHDRLAYEKDLIYRQLTGEGPISIIKRQVGVLKERPKNRLTLIPDAQRLTHRDLVAILSEHVCKCFSGFPEGGLWVPTDYPVKPLPMALEDVTTGVYTLVLDEQDPRLVLAWQVVGVNLGHILVSFSTEPGRRVKFRFITSCETENAYIHHGYPQVFSSKGAQTGFLNLLHQVGYTMPKPVSEAELEQTVKQLSLETSLTVFADDYRLIITPLPSTPPHLQVLRKQQVLPWTQVSPTKQHQLLDAVRSR